MNEPVLTHSGDLIRGEVCARPNRFVITVDFGSGPERVYLGDPGEIDVLQPGSVVLCSPVEDPDRKTGYDAVAVEYDDIYVSLKPALANELLASLIERDAIDLFRGYSIQQREPSYPDHGRADLLLTTPDGESTIVEVKSCTHVEGGIGKFPDRPTKRGRRHLESLQALSASGCEAHIVFVVQRPDVEEVRPYRSVDPAFADALRDAVQSGVTASALSVRFDPPEYYLDATNLPVQLNTTPTST